MKKLMFLILPFSLAVSGLYAQDPTGGNPAADNSGTQKAAEVNKGQKGEQMREQNRLKHEAKKAEHEAKKAEKEAKREAKKAEREAKKEAKKNRPE